MKLIIDIPDISYKWVKNIVNRPSVPNYDEIYQAVGKGIPLEDIKAEPYFWEKCPYYEPDMMFDGEDEYDCGKCKYKDKSVLEDIKAEIENMWIMSAKNLRTGETIYEGLCRHSEVLEIIDKHIKENKK